MREGDLLLLISGESDICKWVVRVECIHQQSVVRTTN